MADVLIITDTIFGTNVASTGYGGGVAAIGFSNLTVVGSTFIGNSGFGNGGGLYFDSTSASPAVLVSGSTFRQNQAVTAAAIHAVDAVDFTVEGSIFEDNVAVESSILRIGLAVPTYVIGCQFRLG